MEEKCTTYDHVRNALLALGALTDESQSMYHHLFVQILQIKNSMHTALAYMEKADPPKT